MPVDDLLPALDAWDETLEWTTGDAHGSYLVDEQLLARNRPLRRRAGLRGAHSAPARRRHRLRRRTAAGCRPGSAQDAPDAVPAPPDGEVDVVARLKPGEPTLLGRTAPEGQLATIHLESVAELVDEPTYTGAYGLVASEDPAVAAMPAAAVKPTRRRGTAPLVRPPVDRLRHPGVRRARSGRSGGAPLRRPARRGAGSAPGERPRRPSPQRRRPTKRTPCSTATEAGLEARP